ncbi:MAG TPA: flagellar biosynthesis protein FlhF [Sedimentibacter sp.]|jgi:flagellar biosynthesis protein FlhF|nr:flagellar biosynthesis protein FlhF [Clostridia bacterium]HQO95993.1 flagellar biosynthesis protein FlhF [Sedimentibacter sp.]
MKVKRYVGETAQEAMQKVKSDLGRDAIILNTRKIRKKGLAGLFSKPLIEVVATIDNDISSGARANNARNEHTIETNEFIKELNENLQGQKNSLKDNTKKHSHADEKELIQQDFMEIKNMLNKVYDAVKVDYENTKLSDVVKKYLKTLEDNEVDKVIVNEIKEKLMETLDSEKQQSDAIVRNTVYNILMKYVKEPEPFSFAGGKKVIIVIGPTGVGKTTTLAKLAANMVLNEKKRVGLITSDTYRIAAVEQLKTYSEIIGVPLSIIYTPGEILNAIESYADKDLILVDTAGRSHKDKYQLMELKTLIKSSINYEVYLVISATTKFSDCIEIIKNYSFLDDYKLLFTKLDETSAFGVILNVAYITKKPISYITTGQSVPDDIEIADNGKIINCLLGDKLYERSS